MRQYFFQIDLDSASLGDWISTYSEINLQSCIFNLHSLAVYELQMFIADISPFTDDVTGKLLEMGKGGGYTF